MGNKTVVPDIINDIENNYNMNDDYTSDTIYNFQNNSISNNSISNSNMMTNNIIIINNDKKCEKYLKNIKDIKERTIIINENIHGIIYKKPNEYGDFNYMINSGDYDNVLFLFDDDQEMYNTSICGKGITKIRKYNEFSNNRNISSAGIIISSNNIGFNILDDKNKNIINICFDKIINFIIEYKYKKLYYSCNENGLIKLNIQYVDSEVIKYITNKIESLVYFFEKV